MKRPFAALVLAAVLLLAAVPAASAASSELSVNGPSGTVRAGETFEVTVELSSGAVFNSAQFILRFDKNEMECVKAEPGPLLAGALASANPSNRKGAAVAAAWTEPLRGGGVLGTFQFKAKTDLNAPRFVLADVLLTDLEGRELEVSIPEDLRLPGFPDARGHWAEDAIRETAFQGLLAGDADGAFHPEGTVTLREMICLLWRAAGRPEPDPKAGASFQELEGFDAETRNAILWGYGRGLFRGTETDAFSSDAALTRQAAVKLLFSYAGGQTGLESLFFSVYDGTFTDSGQIASWAKPAVYWSVYHEILSGNGQNALRPGEAVTRAQLSAILARALDRGIL